MSTVLVTGGSGTLGRELVPLLEAAGHDLRVLSRKPGKGTHTGDLTTGIGVAEATDGAEVIVHAASDTRRWGRADVDQTRNLVRAAATGAAGHIIYVSIVGIDSIPLYYYLRKLACEGVIGSSGVPYTIFRATQFHELIELLLRAVARLPVAPLPLDFKFQTVAAKDVAPRLVELVAAGPIGRAPDFGGPEVFSLGELATAWQAAGHTLPKIMRLPVPGRVGDAFRLGLNTCPENANSGETWAEFVARRPN